MSGTLQENVATKERFVDVMAEKGGVGQKRFKQTRVRE